MAVTDWQSKPVGTVVKRIATGSTPPTSHPEYFVGQIPWFTPGDIGSTRTLVESSRHISAEALSDGRAKLFEEQTLLVTCIGNIGRAGVLQVPASSNQQITALRFADDVDVNYAYYWFVAYQHKLEEQATQAVVPILNNERLKQIDFSYPPLPEQQRIAAILGRADRLRRLRRTARDLSGTYLQSVFLEMFGDPVTNPMGWDIRLLGKSLLIPPHIGTITPAQETGDQLCVRVGEVGQWNVELDSCQRTSLKGRDLERSTLLPGDIVLARAIGSQSHLGKLSILGHTEKTVVFDSHLMRLRLNESIILPEFFMCWMRTDGGRARFMKQARRTAVQFNINAKQIAGIGIPLPPLSLQNQFARIVRKFERLRAQQREAERQAEHLFQALLHRAFRGEL